LEYLWAYFCQVHNGEQLTYTEIKNWSDLMKYDINSQEVEIIMRLESEFWSIENEHIS